MNLLSLDTSGPSVGVALSIDGALRWTGTLCNGNTHSENLLPMVEYALSACGIAPKQLDRIAAVVGPGSFTGVRIGVTTAKALAQATGAQCVAIDALEAFAAGVCMTGDVQTGARVVCPIQDARAGQVYGAAFAEGMPPKRLTEDMAEKLPVYLDRVSALADILLFVGDGVARYRADIQARLGGRARFAAPQHQLLDPASVLALAAYAPACTYEALLPLYLRAPQAERERLAREQAQAEASHA